ncbi:MAG TPA: Xaa-Pro peptidase family protein [Bryobacteraceae bacterium]|nr:Xaa-Pro peptidase family protein [Bryobacteraceae bacterium]
MAHDRERKDWIAGAMREEQFDCAIATLPENVLLLTGYFPVVGTSIALADSTGISLLVPEDERGLAEKGGADEVISFEPASLSRLTAAAEAAREPLSQLIQKRRLNTGAIAYDGGEACEPASYASMHLYGNSILDLCSGVSLIAGTQFWARMRSTLTIQELERLRRACRIAGKAFEAGRQALHAGLLETTAAASFREPLFTEAIGFEGVSRAEGYVSCMAGEHSAHAHGAYARSRRSAIGQNDFVLIHCNSHADGYWTDITRTYCLDSPVGKREQMRRAVFEAREAALAAIRPGARASDVDKAARDVMHRCGLGDAFKHSTGHGVGFSAIDPNALPRLHPLSPDLLAPGMVLNVEPAAYVEGAGGFRHCDVVTVTRTGVEVLTPFQCSPE